MMRLHFDQTGSVAGAFIKTYLLEKSRVVTITNPERSYHIFYQVMTSSHPAKGAALGGMKVDKMRLLNQSQCYTLTVVRTALAPPRARPRTVHTAKRVAGRRRV